MKYEFLTNLSLEEALNKLLDGLKQAGTAYQTERIPTRSANGRVCACAQYAKRSSPHYLSCAMDGIAVRSGLLTGAGESTPAVLTESQFQMVDTGDPLPEGADCVVMIEDVVFDENGGVILYAPQAPWSNVRQIGEDISMGDMIIPSFTKITPSLIGALMAGGIFELDVVKKPVVAILPTGDEIVSAESELKDGDVPEYNSAIFSAMLSDWGAEATVYPVIPDDLSLLKEAVTKAAHECDAVITIAGSSAGRDDYTSTILKELGTLLVHGIAIKPGKPAVLGHISDTPFFGIPGYPVSGIIVMEQIVRPALALLTKDPAPAPDEAQVTLTRKAPSSLKYREFIRTRAAGMNGTLAAMPLPRGAGIISGFAKADGIIEIPQNNEGLETGETANMRLLKPLSMLENAVCVTGSHDPLIDEIADLLARSDQPIPVTSSHVGSMGGIQAIKQKSAHMGGIHLLDPETGEYNISYLQKHFKEQPVVLVRGVIRKQGLMLPKGNPLHIQRIIDLPGISYVNRQKGAGTRILLDYLLKQEGIPASAISGYAREEFTHTAVAAAIAAGSADCGMGIYSAAQIYGLDFVPLWDEEYDFLIDADAFHNENVQRFLEVLRSEAFKDRLAQLGGYGWEHTGEIKWSTQIS